MGTGEGGNAVRRKDSLRCGDVTIEEEMLYLMENIRQLLAELPEDIVKYSEDSARDENGEIGRAHV